MTPRCSLARWNHLIGSAPRFGKLRRVRLSALRRTVRLCRSAWFEWASPLPAKIGRPPVDTDKSTNGHRNRSPPPSLPGVGGIGGYSAPIRANTFLAIRYFRSFPPLARGHPPSGARGPE